MEQPLHSLHDDWSLSPIDVQNTLHPKQVIAVAQHERVKPIGDVLPMQRCIELKTKRSNVCAMAVHILMVMVVVFARRDGGRAIAKIVSLGVEPRQNFVAFRPGVEDIRYRERVRRRHLSR
jgi:hypothetical protein